MSADIDKSILYDIKEKYSIPTRIQRIDKFSNSLSSKAL